MTESVEPQDVRSEEALIGAILTVPARTKRIEIQPEDFYRPRHALIWDAAVTCAHNGGCDPITVAAELERRGQLEEVGGRDRLQALAVSTPAPGNAKSYARRIREKAELRRVRRQAQALLDAVDNENEDAVAVALDSLGHPIRYVDVASGELLEHCPTCSEKDKVIERMEHGRRADLRRISTLEGKAEKKAREHKHWAEIECVHMWYRAATGHFGVKFGTEEFAAALPRWKENGRGRANPAIPALKAVAGAAFDPTTTTMKNGREKRYDEWSLIFRNQEKFAAMQERAPVKEGHPDYWKVWLWRQIQNNLK